MPREGTPYEETVGQRYGFSPTSNSGAKHGDADKRHKNGRFIVECKDWNTAGITIDGKELKKLKRQAIMWGDGNWVRFLRNAEGEEVVAMNEALFRLMLSVCDGKIVCPKCETRLQPDW